MVSQIDLLATFGSVIHQLGFFFFLRAPPKVVSKSALSVPSSLVCGNCLHSPTPRHDIHRGVPVLQRAWIQCDDTMVSKGALVCLTLFLASPAAVMAMTCKPTFDKVRERWSGLGSRCEDLEVNGQHVFYTPKANPKSLMDAVSTQSPQLESMRFHKAELNDHNLDAIAQFVRDSKKLRSLSLVNNQEISDAGAAKLASVLTDLPTTSKFGKLDLTGSVAMTDEAVRLLASTGDRTHKCFHLTFEAESPHTRTIMDLSNAFCVVVQDGDKKARDLGVMASVAEKHARQLDEKDAQVEECERERLGRRARWLQWSWLLTGLAGVALGAAAANKLREAADHFREATEAKRPTEATTQQQQQSSSSSSSSSSSLGTPGPASRRQQLGTVEKAALYRSNAAHAHTKKKFTDYYTGLPVAAQRSTIIRDVTELHETPRKSGHDRSPAASSATGKRGFSSDLRGPSPSPSKRARTPILR
jgi:hypothetical protein